MRNKKFRMWSWWDAACDSFATGTSGNSWLFESESDARAAAAVAKYLDIDVIEVEVAIVDPKRKSMMRIRATEPK